MEVCLMFQLGSFIFKWGVVLHGESIGFGRGAFSKKIVRWGGMPPTMGSPPMSYPKII